MNENKLKDTVHIELTSYLSFKSTEGKGISREDALEIASYVFADFSIRLMDAYGEPTRERTKLLMNIINEFYDNAFNNYFSKEDYHKYAAKSMEILQDNESRKERINNFYESILPR